MGKGAGAGRASAPAKRGDLEQARRDVGDDRVVISKSTARRGCKQQVGSNIRVFSEKQWGARGPGTAAARCRDKAGCGGVRFGRSMGTCNPRPDMTVFALLSFFAIMVALAAIPSASVALVVARSASLGIRNGAAVALGIVAGDLVFVAIALLGMNALAASIGAVFSVFKYLGGAYLIWLGVKLLRAKEPVNVQAADVRGTTLLASFAAGWLLTLGDVKAILFYASLFPALTNGSRLSGAEIVAVIVITVCTVGGVKLAYAFAARAIIERLRVRRAGRHTKGIAGGLMIGTGSYILIKS